MKKISFSSFLCALVTAGLYYLMNYSSLSQGLKWYLFGAHLMLALLGFIFALASLFKKKWLSLLSLIICGYFLVIQLGGF
jgi:hypothetical protein